MQENRSGRTHRWLANLGLAVALGTALVGVQAAPGGREGPPSATREGGGGREGPPSATREGAPPQAGPRDGGGRGGQGDRGDRVDRSDRGGRGGQGEYNGQSGRSRGGDGRWYDGAHGHSHYYPAPGWAVRSPPQHSRVVFWAGVNYNFFDGVWYAPGPRGYAVVRPPYGILVADLPAFRTLVTIGGLSYFYANGVYYREREGGYEVVPTPVDTTASGGPVSDKLFVYPRQGQTAQQQSADEYDCHRWAVSQTGFDPTAAAVGQPSGDASRRGDYQRARSACLEGRNYTVR